MVNPFNVLKSAIAFAFLIASASAFAGTIIDNSDAGFSTVGNWGSSTGVSGYYGSDYAYTSKGDGSRTATWQFSIATSGNYDVAAQWAAHPNRATDAPYAIYNNGALVARVTKNQEINGGQFNLLGSYNLTAGTVTVVLNNNASGFVVADAVQLSYTGGAVNSPPNGTIDSPTGNITVTVGDFVNFAGTYSDPDGDPAQAYLWQFGSGSGLADSIAQDPGPMQFNNTGTFTVTFTVTDSNNQQDPTPAQVTVTVVPQGNTTITDDTDAGFSTAGNWGYSNGVPGYYGSDYAYTSGGDGSRTATWQIGIAAAGKYNVQAQWAAYSNRATNAPYKLYNNGNFVALVRVNQQINGGQFNLLGSYTLAAGTLTVVMSNDASGFVIADAIRVSPATSPQLVITAPLNNPVVTASYMTVDASVSNLPAGWGVKFVLNGNSATSATDYSIPFEYTFVSLPKAQYGVDAYLVDANGNIQPGFGKHAEFGIGDYFIAFGDSITRGSHDDITSDNTSLDGRNTGGGYEPILNNLLTSKSGYPQTVINSGVSGNKTTDALLRLPDVLSANPDANYVLILLGTNDAYFTGLKSGYGLLPGDKNYSGSYKDNMQQIISTVVASGKTPVLAKVLNVEPLSDPTNPLIQEYNMVIDELVLSNGITLVPPDFYTYFSNHPELFADPVNDHLHPNGNGYISMGNLWSNVFTY